MFTYEQRHGIEVEVNPGGFYERVRQIGQEDWFTPNEPEFHALVAQFNGQSFYGMAW